MKKVFCFMFVLFVLLAMAGCGQNQADHNSILGSWEAETELSILGVSVSDDEENQTADMVYCFEFYEDGAGKSSIIIDEKYAEDIRNMNASFTYILDGDKLELTHEDGNTQVFTVSFSGENLILDGRAHMELVRKK